MIKLFFSFLFICSSLSSQNLILKDLLAFYSSDEEAINEKLINKGWNYNGSTPADEDHYKVISWIYNGGNQYFFLNVPTFEQKKNSTLISTNCTYTFVDKDLYKRIKSDLIILGYKKGLVHTKEKKIVESFSKDDKIGIRISTSTVSDGVITYNIHISNYKAYIFEESKDIAED